MSGAVLLVCAVLLTMLMPTLAAQTTARAPRIIQASSTAPASNAQLSALVADVRKQADAFVFLSGGASKMREDHQRQLLAMFGALSLVTKTGTMYWLFAALAQGRRSVTIVANGGGITLAEVESNVGAGRRMILIEGSGRAADALVSMLQRTTPSDAEVKALRDRAEKAMLMRRPELFQIVPLQAGAPGLRDAIVAVLGGTK